MAEKRIKRRKPADLRKTVYLRVRLTPDQDREIREAAGHAGISVSAWVIERLLKAARTEMGQPPGPGRPSAALKETLDAIARLGRPGSAEDVQEALGISINNARARVHRALRKRLLRRVSRGRFVPAQKEVAG